MRGRIAAFGLCLTVPAVVNAQTPIASGFAEGAYHPARGITDPQVVKQVRPSFTSEAMREKITGTVELEAVVEPNGKVERVRVMRSLDATFGLDDEAIKAAKQWLFKPGMLKDTPVPVVVWIAMEFRLTSRDDPTPIRIEITPQTTTGAPLTTSPTAPVLLESPPPDYTPQARLLAIRGVVQLEAIVLEDGTVATPKVLKSLERGLDDQAIAAVGKWRFRPAMLGERPVAVPVILRVEFRNQPDQ